MGSERLSSVYLRGHWAAINRSNMLCEGVCVSVCAYVQCICMCEGVYVYVSDLRTAPVRKLAFSVTRPRI